MPFKIGDRVHWTDPDEDACSCDGKIVDIDEDGIISIVNDAGGEVEALAHELRHV